jgi:hypothetical protein
MNRDETFGLPAGVRAAVEEILSRRQPLATAAAASGPAEVLFYDQVAFDFAFGWVGTSSTRWMFPIQAEGPTYVYYVCMRLQQLGYTTDQVLFATSGQGAVFYATVASAAVNSSGVIGLLPGNTPVFDFGGTLSAFAPNATVTLICPSSAADNDYEGTVYHGTELVGNLAIYMNGKVVATDAAVTYDPVGTAATPGNIWTGDPQSGTASILCPAPGAGNTQNFPLGITPVCG